MAWAYESEYNLNFTNEFANLDSWDGIFADAVTSQTDN